MPDPQSTSKSSGKVPSVFGYPRPQLERPQWLNLNGSWDFAFDAQALWTLPQQVQWHAKIQVPYSPETPASGIGNTGFYRVVWYRRTFDAPAMDPSQRLLLHFGAVDYTATVWVNDLCVAQHHGGYTPFSADITDTLIPGGPQVVVVRAEDDPADLAKPRGKQDWQLQPHSIWYPRTTGIWQTVWMECVPATWITFLRWTPCLERWEIGLDARMQGLRRDDLFLHVRLEVGDQVLADDRYRIIASEVVRRIALSDPGIDDYRNELLWSPATPTLIHANLELCDDSGSVLDRVVSYTALRSVGIQGDRFLLNGRPFYLRMVLDQGYWPQTGLSSPSDAALRHDVELTKAMGFNGARRHQKISEPRYLYWADRLGLLVWEEMPSAYRFTKTAVERLTREWLDAIRRDVSHPCIVAWVPFNESWGVPDLPDNPSQRHAVQALYHLTKTLDPTRPVIGNDGWESVATDIIGIHDYDENLHNMARRYGGEETIERLFKRERPGGRMLVVGEATPLDQPLMLTEFGGIAMSPGTENETWGYRRARDGDELMQLYVRLLKTVRAMPILAGFCYTQFADTYQEANGLLFADRRPKFPIEHIALATAGPGLARDQIVEAAWRQRMMSQQRYKYALPLDEHLNLEPH